MTFSKTQRAVAAVFLGLLIAVAGASTASAAAADEYQPDRICRDADCED